MDVVGASLTSVVATLGRAQRVKETTPLGKHEKVSARTLKETGSATDSTYHPYLDAEQRGSRHSLSAVRKKDGEGKKEKKKKEKESDV